jgi:hypothetical protein
VHVPTRVAISVYASAMCAISTISAAEILRRLPARGASCRYVSVNQCSICAALQDLLAETLVRVGRHNDQQHGYRRRKNSIVGPTAAPQAAAAVFAQTKHGRDVKGRLCTLAGKRAGVLGHMMRNSGHFALRVPVSVVFRGIPMCDLVSMAFAWYALSPPFAWKSHCMEIHMLPTAVVLS